MTGVFQLGYQLGEACARANKFEMLNDFSGNGEYEQGFRAGWSTVRP